MKDDGGYFALKGFSYQIDESLHLLLTQTDDNKEVAFEQIQDISDDIYVMQVKYHEVQTYSPSKVREPILQLLQEHKQNPTKSYILFCHFKDKPEEKKKLNIAELDRIFSIRDSPSMSQKMADQKRLVSSFSNREKEAFLDSLTVAFSPTFQKLYDLVLSEIHSTFNCADQDEALIYYAILLEHIISKITSSLARDQRKSTKANLIRLINQGKKLIFNNAYRELLGDENFYKYVHKRCFSYRNIDYWERIFIIECLPSDSNHAIKTAIISLIEKYLRITKRAVKSGAPYIHLALINPASLITIKQMLRDDGFFLKDGHDFNGSMFSLESITEKTSLENHLQVKFVDSITDLLALSKMPLHCAKQIIQFYRSSPIEIESDYSIRIKELIDISNCIN